MLNAIFLKVLNLSITATWVILAVILIHVFLRKTPKWIQCALWGLVGLRFILPFSLRSSFSLLHSTQPIPENITSVTEPTVNTGLSGVDHLVNPILSEFAHASGSSDTPFLNLVTAGSIIWVIGMAVILFTAAVSYGRLKKQTEESLKVEEGVFCCDSVLSPFILGILQPKIYLPSGMDVENYPGVIAHEKAHIRRKNHWWKPLGYLFLAVHWFNPFMWVAYILLCRDIELACDEKVIKEMDAQDRVAYSQEMLDFSVDSFKITACPLAFGEVGVGTRVKAVLSYKKPAFWVLLLALIVTIGVIVSLLTDPKQKPVPITVNGVEYTVLSTSDITVTYVPSPYSGENEMIGSLVLDLTSAKENKLDLRSMASCKEVQSFWVRTNGSLKELNLPEMDYVGCYVQADRIGNISGDVHTGVELILSASPSSLNFEEGTVVNVTVEEPDNLDFLKEGHYDTVSVFSAKSLVPSGTCEIRSLSLSGGNDWDLTPLSGNRTLQYLSVQGDGIDLAPLKDTAIEQLYLGGVCDLFDLQDLTSLETLHVPFGSYGITDLGQLSDLKQVQLINIVTDSDVEDNYGTRYQQEVLDICSKVAGLDAYRNVLIDWMQHGKSVGVTRKTQTETVGSVFDLLERSIGGIIETSASTEEFHFACTPLQEGRFSISRGFSADHPGYSLWGVPLDKVMAVADGTVIATGEDTVNGKYVQLLHTGGYTTFYAHCDEVSAKMGDVVQANEEIAEMGQSGNASAYTLYFELRDKDGVVIDPTSYLEEVSSNMNPTRTATISGGFTAYVIEIIPDYVVDDHTPSMALVRCYQDYPFVINLSEELAKEVEEGEAYYFTVADKTVALSAVDPTDIKTILDLYELEIIGVREPTEEEVGLLYNQLAFK